MTDQAELNKKLAEWAGFEYKDIHNPQCDCGAIIICLVAPDGTELPEWRVGGGMPSFTQSLDACLKWLVLPKLYHCRILIRGGYCDIEVILEKDGPVYIQLGSKDKIADTLCKAIEQLVDEETK